MKNTPQSGNGNRLTTGALAGCLALSLLVAGAGVRAESLPLVLNQGDSVILRFDRMQRVATADPQVADVVVSTLDELLVLAQGEGRTKLYVWDRHGRHDYAVVVRAAEQAQDAARRLRALLPAGVTYEILDDSTLVLEGEVGSPTELERVSQLAGAVAEGVKVVNLVTLQDATLTPAQRQARALRRLLGERFEYVTWDPTTVMVLGQVDSETELTQIDQLVKAASTGGVQVANLVTVGSPTGPAPSDEIQQALGSEYRVWPLYGRTVVVEGTARDETALQRVTKLLEAFQPRAQVVNLVRVASTGALPLAQQRDLLQSAVGDGLQVRTVADQALVVEGVVTDKAAFDQVDRILALFSADTKVQNLVRIVSPEKRQILVHVQVIDVRGGELERVGFTHGEIRGGDIGTPNFSWLLGFNSISDVQNLNQWGVRLNAMVQDNLAKVLAQPNLLVNDGEKAQILVGGEIPIPVPSAGAGGTTITIEYKPYGVQLDILPEITPEGRIRLQVSPEVSAIDASNTVVISGIGVPSFTTRKATTTVDVNDGGTLAIGGLISNSQSRVVSAIPFLSSLPIIGELFKSREFQDGKTELVILVTPEIMKPGEQGAAVPPSLVPSPTP